MSKEKACTQNACNDQENADKEAMRKRMNEIKNKILVLSGKGGVGKSTVAVNLAVSLSHAGKKVGLLDIDVHGPSIPKMLRLEDKPVTGEGDTITPVEFSPQLKVMSLGLMMQGKDEAVIWRGPRKHGLIKQFLTNVAWGKLDYLGVDSPPGTGDEPLSIAQFMANEAKALIVTTPQEVALADVRKSIAFCRKLSLPVLGVVENMSGFVCPHCGEETLIFKSGGGEEMALGMEVPFLGRIPVDPGVVDACDAGQPYVHRNAQSGTAKAFERVIQEVLQDGGS